ncbi:MAG: family 78 glycoside hydrolase catalytic domain [Microbacterium sp.]
MSTTWMPAFITASPRQPTERVVRLRRRFSLDESHGDPVRATLRTTALGVIESDLNDTPTSPAVLTPGWTSYEWRVRYLESDVTTLLEKENALELRLAAGWYAGTLTWENQVHLYGDRTAAAAELSIEFADGHVQRVATDETWEWTGSSTLSADLYNGQIIDARIEEPDQWDSVAEYAAPAVRYEPYTSPAVTRQAQQAVERVWRSPQGALLVDFGQNLVGWTRLTVNGHRGAEIVLRHAEELEDGELAIRPLRGARATDAYTLSGGEDVFEPTFTFHGFRYAEITGWPGADDDIARALTAVVVSSDLRRIGTFASSHELLNRLHENVVWGLRGNFLDVPTDCPQRDERLGWTGDIAVFAPTAAYLFDVQGFLTNWMRDLYDETVHAEGMVPFVVPDALKLVRNPRPDVMRSSPQPTAVWGDAAAWVPWALYQHDGDVDRLASMYPAMALHASAIANVLSPEGLWDVGFQFGDWLDPAAPPEDAAAAVTPTEVVATACAFRTFGILTRAAETLGRIDDATRFGALTEVVREGFLRAYLTDGALQPETPTGYALAIAFGLLDGESRRSAGDRLAALVAANGHRIATGFAGTPYVTDALTLTGHSDVAYRLLLQTECPSWLYPVTMGATTVWERWDSKLPDGSVNEGGMTSFNHYALGSVADWLHRTVGGIAPAEPGYSSILVAPVPGAGVEWCESTLDVPAGTIRVRWELDDGRLHVRAQLPAAGILRLPGADDEDVAAGVHERVVAWDARTRT